ncbi:alpha/beta hydrolase [uncultured Croceitalea sp.]|uniref:alpha/beta fold hydrolase n=1 Tax=uncultured Croceitalea sp. TaxID=1798908 RepID=UPI0033066F5C
MKKEDTILFLHGGPDHKEEWNAVIKLLDEYQCLAMDLPGFGLTSKISNDFDFTIRSQVNYLSDWLINKHTSEKILLVGHDIGAILSLAWASEHKEEVSGLLLMNTVADRNFEWHKMAKIWGHKIWGRIFMFFVNNTFFKMGFSKDFPELAEVDVNNVAKGLSKTARRSLLKLFQKMTAPDYYDGWEDKFKKVVTEIPTTVLWGKQDPLVTQEYAHRLGGKVVMIEDCGHWVPRQKPYLVAEQIKKMLG